MNDPANEGRSGSLANAQAMLLFIEHELIGCISCPVFSIKLCFGKVCTMCISQIHCANLVEGFTITALEFCGMEEGHTCSNVQEVREAHIHK
jgi:hypothetical protein